MQKIALYPSLLAIVDRREEWTSEIADVAALSTGIHYDIGDADFVPSLMLDPADIALVDIGDIQSKTGKNLPIDVHLMVQKPSTYFPTILSFPTVKAVAFHVECQEDIHETIQTLKNAGMKVGLAILHTTPVDHLDPYLLEIDYVLVMTIKGGYAGTPFIPETLEKVTEIRHKNPDMSVLVDGGVNQTTLPLCIAAGATRTVMSSALFGNPDHSWLEKYVESEK